MELASGVQGKHPVRRLRRAARDGRLEAHATAHPICCGPLTTQVHVGGSETTTPAKSAEAAAAAANADDLHDVDNTIATTSTSNGKLQPQLLSYNLSSCPEPERRAQVVEPDAAASREREEKRREAVGEAKEAIVPLLVVSPESASEATALHNARMEHMLCMESVRCADTAENHVLDAPDILQTSSKVCLISVDVSTRKQ